jgi:hypothetical protein
MSLTPTTKFNRQQAQKILSADLCNLTKKVASGRLLTAGERALVQAAADGADPVEQIVSTSAQPTFAPNQSALAEVFGCTRQVIAYHCKRPGNPGRTADGRYNVAEWRAYLKLVGRIAVDDDDSTGPELVNGRPQIRADYGDGCYSAIDAVGEAILPALTEALKAAGGKLSGKVKDVVAFYVWTVLARAIDQRGTSWGFESYFAPDGETGEAFYPGAITQLAARITAANSAPAEQ